MQKGSSKRKIRKAQHQQRPGLEKKMSPHPVFNRPELPGSYKLKDKIAFITGGDSGIGKAVAILFAKESADIAPSYLFLACNDSSYISGQFLHPNDGEIING
jgi:hypothetical protein